MAAKRKGQAATEYLIIVSIVVVIALVAVNTVSGFPSLISGTSKTKSADFWNRADVAITAYSVFTDGSSIMLVKNRKGYVIDIVSIDVDGKLVPIGKKNIAPGTVEKIEFPAGALGGGAANSEYTKKIAFKYADSEEPKTELTYAPDVPLVGNYEQK